MEISMDEKTTVVAASDKIQRLIYVVRGKQVMMDSDLAMLYRVETGNLNKAMKRNQERFPEEFCFQLTKEEYEDLKFQIGSSSDSEHGGRRKLPYVYTEQGIAMLSAVLRSDIAIRVSIQIMKTFVELRRYLAHGAFLLEKVNDLEIKQIESDRKRDEFEQKTDKRFEEVFDYIASHEESNQKIFFDGQIFDAFRLMTELILQAEKNIILIDGYVDVATLNILSKKKNCVDVCIYTLPSARMTVQDINNFNAQYPNLEVKRTTAFHDRFLMIDEEKGYHIGASLKDAGKKCFGINKIEDIGVIKDILQRAKLTS
ncbi:MAG: ORF6N domain-containing protein [Lachnospiraceae bacterium]|nr:ORF6N domain-containing protein [Lachnospiraceae bacterium]